MKKVLLLLLALTSGAFSSGSFAVGVPLQSDVVVINDLQTADGVSQIILRATVRDLGGVPQAGETVTFSANAAVALSAGACVTNGFGICSVTATSTTAGTFASNARLLGVDIKFSPISYTFVAGAADNTNSTVAVTNNPGDADGAAVTLTATILDANSNPVPGETVTFAATADVDLGAGVNTQETCVTNASGECAVSASSTVAATGYSTVVSIGAGVLSNSPATYDIDAGAIDLSISTIVAVPGTGILANGVATSTITVTLRDSNSNIRVAGGDAVAISSTGSAVVSAVSDNTDGTYTATVTDLAVETVTISATAGGLAITSGDPTVTYDNVDPTLDTLVSDVSVLEDAVDTIIDLSSNFSDVNTNQSLTYTVQSNTDVALVTTSIIGSDLTLDFQDDQNGSATIVVRATDDSGSFVEDTFDVSVTPVNDDPTISNIGAQSTDEDTDITGIAFSVDEDIASDSNEDDQTLTITATSSNTALVPDLNITVNYTEGVGIDASTLSPTLDITPVANQNGTTTITVQVDDGNGGVVTDDFVLTVNAVNDDPVITVPGAQSLDEDVQTAITGISVADVDAGETGSVPPEITVTLDVNNGTISVTASGATVSNNGSASVTVEGTVANVSTAIGTAQYTSDLNYNGADTLTLTANDGGNVGTGGGTDIQETVAITVNQVNDDPVVTVPGAQLINEDAQTAIGGISVVDLDAAEAGSSAPEISVVVSASNGVINITAGGATVSNNDTNSVTVEGTVGNVSTALGTLLYTSDLNYNGADTLVVTANDGGNVGSGGGSNIVENVGITVVDVNDPPEITSNGGATLDTTFDENATGTITTIVADDLDSGDGSSGAALEYYIDSGPDSALFQIDVSSGALSFNSAQNFEAQADANNDNTFEVVVRVEDDDSANDTQLIRVALQNVNEAPTAAPLTYTVPYTEDQGSVALTDIVVSDIDDSLTGQNITATLTLSPSAAGALTTSGSATYNSGSGVWTITDTLANVNAALAAVSFTTGADHDTDSTITTHIEDQDGEGPADGVITLDVTPVNDAPTESDATQTVAYTEDDATVNLTNIVIDDVDDADYAQTITVTMTLADVAAGTLTTSGSATFVGGVWSITDTLAAVNTALGSVAFEPAADYDTDTTISVDIVDQDAAGPGTGTITLDVTPVNDAPTATNTTQIIIYNEDTNGVDALQPDIVITDVDDDDVAQTITVTLSMANYLPVTLNTPGSSTWNSLIGEWEITDTVANVNAALAALTFDAETDWDTDSSFTVQILDQDLAGPVQGTVTLDVVPLNDDPVIDDQTFDIDENSAYGTVVGTVVAYNEESVGCTPPDPGCQTLTFNVSGSAFDIDDDGVLTVKTVSALDREATDSIVVIVTVTDDGTPVESDTAIITVDLNPLNDNAPVGLIDSVSGDEQSTFSFNVLTVGTDIDADLPPESLFVSEVAGDPAKVGVAQELSANGKVVGELTINANGSSTFVATSDVTVEEFDIDQVYTVSDGTFEDTDVLVQIELNPVNDNDPELTSAGDDLVADGLEWDEDTYSSSNPLIIDLVPYFLDLDIDTDGLLDSSTGDDNDGLVFTVVGNTNSTLANLSITDTDLEIYAPTHEHGTSDITIRATDTADGGGNFVDLAFTITVNSVNDAPVYIPGSYTDLVVLEDSGDIVIALDAAFSDADIDADSNPSDDTKGYLITVQDVPNIEEVDTVHVDIPEADEISEDVGVPDPLGRTVEYIADDPTVTLQIAADAHGEITVTVRRQDAGVPDGTPLFAEETFTITVQGVGDDTPTAEDDTYADCADPDDPDTCPLTMYEDGDAIVIDVLANDYLGDAPAGVITAGQEITDSLGGDHAWRTTSRLTDRTNTGNYEIEMNGEVSCSADGCQDDETPDTTVDGSGLLDRSIVYKPGPDFSGEDSFVYCIQDAFPGSEAAFTADRTPPTTDQRCATVTVNVIPVNDLPRVPGDTIYTMDQADLLIVPVEEGLATLVSGVDNTHIDGIGCDPFDAGCNPGPGDPQPDELFFYFQSATTASGEGELVAPFETDGSFNYRPNATFSGSDSFLVDVCEGPGMTVDNCIFGLTVSITVESVSGDPEGSSEDAVEVDFDLANIPLELPVGPEANVLIVNDDSGSMDWDISTDQTDGVYYFDGTNYYVRYVMKATAGSSYVAASEESAPGSGVWRLRSSEYNTIYYNPEIQYQPWKGLNASDVDFPDSNPNVALHNPLVTSGSNYATNLELPQDYTGRAVFTTPIVCNDVCTNTDKDGNCTNYQEQCTGGNTSWQSVNVEDYWIPRYYTWDDKNSNGVLDATPSPVSDPANSEGTLVEIRTGNTYPKYDDRTDCVTLPSNCTYEEELQNFANWFTYNRNREFTAKSALGQVVAASENIRIGYAKLNSSSNIRDIETMNSSERTGAKADLLDAIYLTGSSGGTPLRRALRNAGRHFECVSNDIFGSGSSTEPGEAGCPIFEAPAGNCQQNFTLLISDGTWNGSSPNIGDADDPSDGDDQTDSNFDGGVYTGSSDNTLADVAMHYYERDLHPLGNEVPTTARDRDGAATDAFEDSNNEKMHQHMKTYTIGFGVSGVVEDGDVPTDYTQSFNWGNPFNSNARKIDDMRHAAVNGRGQYLSAGNASGLAEALLDAFDEFQKASGSASAVSFNSQEVQEDTLVFRAFYNTKNNTGDLIAQEFFEDGSVGDEAWNAAGQLDLVTYDERNIITYDRDPTSVTYGDGIPFRPLSLNDDQRALFISDGMASEAQQNLEVLQKVNYLRGDTSNERPAGNFRERPGVEGKLGDIVHSAPTFIGPPNRSGRESAGWAPGYGAFQTTWADRTPIVYVAANDGMLHGFEAETGDEAIAYVPDNLMTSPFSRKISNLLNYEYTHEYFVDSSPAVNDVYIDWDNDGDKEWRTVLVNGQGAGAKAYFALDITDPTKFDEDTADQVVLWEFTDEDDAYPVVDNNPDDPLTNADSTQRMDLQSVPQPVKDLGYTIGVPTLSMSNIEDPDGTFRWIATFGNGYNSTAGIAKLFVLFLDGGVDGVWCHPDKKHNTVLDATPLPTGCTDTDTNADYDFVKLDTTFGVFQDSEGNNVPNGLGEPRLIDFDGNGTADYAYAGDMEGNLFRFNMTSGDFQDWSVTKIFEARYKPDTIYETKQPITTQPLAIFHPTEDEGIILLFGTGSYIRTGDAVDDEIQSIYGIWDRFGPEEIEKSELVEQWYTGVNDSTQGQVRVLSENPVDYSIVGQKKGWYIDLDVPEPEDPPATGEPTGDPQFPGERAVRNIQVRGGLAFTASVFPRPEGACVGQAGGALLSFCPDTGSSECFINELFDLNNDGSFNSDDALADDSRTGAGIILTNETPPTDSAFIGSQIVTQQGTDLTVIDTNTSYGANTGRTSWRRLDAAN